MQVWLPARPEQIGQTRFFLRMRIVEGLFAVMGAVRLWQHPSNTLDWIGDVSLACVLLSWSRRQPNESWREYAGKPRGILTIVLAIVAFVSSSWWLARHF